MAAAGEVVLQQLPSHLCHGWVYVGHHLCLRWSADDKIKCLRLKSAVEPICICSDIYIYSISIYDASVGICVYYSVISIIYHNHRLYLWFWHTRHTSYEIIRVGLDLVPTLLLCKLLCDGSFGYTFKMNVLSGPGLPPTTQPAPDQNIVSNVSQPAPLAFQPPDFDPTLKAR
jgi:hypothetical protein